MGGWEGRGLRFLFCLSLLRYCRSRATANRAIFLVAVISTAVGAGAENGGRSAPPIATPEGAEAGGDGALDTRLLVLVAPVQTRRLRVAEDEGGKTATVTALEGRRRARGSAAVGLIGAVRTMHLPVAQPRPRDAGAVSAGVGQLRTPVGHAGVLVRAVEAVPDAVADEVPAEAATVRSALECVFVAARVGGGALGRVGDAVTHAPSAERVGVGLPALARRLTALAQGSGDHAGVFEHGDAPGPVLALQMPRGTRAHGPGHTYGHREHPGYGGDAVGGDPLFGHLVLLDNTHGAGHVGTALGARATGRAERVSHMPTGVADARGQVEALAMPVDSWHYEAAEAPRGTEAALLVGPADLPQHGTFEAVVPPVGDVVGAAPAEALDARRVADPHAALRVHLAPEAEEHAW